MNFNFSLKDNSNGITWLISGQMLVCSVLAVRSHTMVGSGTESVRNVISLSEEHHCNHRVLTSMTVPSCTEIMFNCTYDLHNI